MSRALNVWYRDRLHSYSQATGPRPQTGSTTGNLHHSYHGASWAAGSPPVHLVRIGPHIVSLAERYDRYKDDGIVERFHQEDFRQAQGRSHIGHKLALPGGQHTDPGNLHRNHWDAFAEQLGMAPKRIQRLIRIQSAYLDAHLDSLHRAFLNEHGLTHELDKAQAVIKQQITKAKRDWTD